MRLSPLQLIEYTFDDVVIRSVEGYAPDQEFSSNLVFFPGKLSMSAETELRLIKEEESYSDFGVSLTLHVGPRTDKVAPYTADVTVRGVVRMHLNLETDQAEERRVRALVNGVSLLFGAAREMIATVTSRSKHGQLLLPSLNFAELAKAPPEGMPTPPIEVAQMSATKRKLAKPKAKPAIST